MVGDHARRCREQFGRQTPIMRRRKHLEQVLHRCSHVVGELGSHGVTLDPDGTQRAAARLEPKASISRQRA